MASCHGCRRFTTGPKDGAEPVDEFIEALRDPDKQAALDNQIERLNMLRPNDPPLPFPWSSQLEGEFRELRCHYGPELYRVIYRRSRNLFVLLHMFRLARERLGGLQGANGRGAAAAAARRRSRRTLSSRRTWLINSGKLRPISKQARK